MNSLSLDHKNAGSLTSLLAAQGLSEREIQIASYASMGFTAKETAAILGISPSTVGTYRQRTYEKLGISKIADLKKIAAASGDASTPIDRAVEALAPLPNNPFLGVPLALYALGSAAFLGALIALLCTAANVLSRTAFLPVLAVLLIMALALFLAGEAIYLKRRRTSIERRRRFLGANRDFESHARGFLARLGMTESKGTALIRIAQGASPSDICDELGIARGTLNSTRSRGYAELGVHTVDQLAKVLLVGAMGSIADDEEAGESARAASESAYARETSRIIDAAQGEGFMYAGAGLGVILVLILSALATWLSGGAIR